ncbi:MAG: iron-containing alcohol dehydrogenase [Deltaproteobacteria bacterium]|nr:iron-containing alcohol dehydrogenase [Deltaproteobacteria bacterium]
MNEKGGVSRIAEFASGLNCTRVLVVTDKGVVAAGHYDKLAQRLSAANIKFFSYQDVGPDPSEQMVYSATEIATRNAIDCVVGIGGGSALDVAKAASVIAKTKIRLDEIFGIEKVAGTRLPLILIPTTAGTGSEVTYSSVITAADGKKKVVISNKLYADVALLDVELTSTMPTFVAATTGIDAIVHAIEAYTSVNKKNPISDMLAIEALRLLIGNIEQAVSEGDHWESKSKMLLGAMLAGQAFSNASVSSIHGFAYPMGEMFHLSHGLSNALMLSPILKFNAPAAAREYGAIGKNLFKEVSGDSDENATAFLIRKIDRILASLNLDKKLRDFGVKDQNVEDLAKAAFSQERLNLNNPRKIGLDDARAIYQSAF